MVAIRGVEAAGKARLAGAALAVTLALLWAGPAEAGTPIQLGQVATGNPDTCGDTTSWVQRTVAGAPSYTVPSAGTITSWAHRALNVTPTSGRLQVWRPAEGTDYTLVGRSEVKAFTPSLLNNFPINLPVQAGDVLGFRESSLTFPGCKIPTADPGDAITAAFGTDPTPGATVTFSAMPIGPFRLNVAATFDPTDPAAPPDTSVSLTANAQKKQKVGRLKVSVSGGNEAISGEIGGRAVAKKRGVATAAAKKRTKKKIKPKSFSVAADQTKTLGVKYKNHRKSVKKLRKLLKRKAFRKKSIAKLNVSVTDQAGNSANETVKIKLRP